MSEPIKNNKTKMEESREKTREKVRERERDVGNQRITGLIHEVESRGHQSV